MVGRVTLKENFAKYWQGIDSGFSTRESRKNKLSNDI